MKQLLTSCTDFNIWANRRIVQLVRQMEDGLIDEETPSSFNTIRKTIYHIWGAQVIWLNRLQGISLTEWPSIDQQGNFAGYDLYLIQQSEDFHKHIVQKPESYPETLCMYRVMTGKEYQNRVWQIVMHCMNHSTYHRGQIITMMRTLGITDVIPTDYILYLREMQSSNL